MVPGHASPEPVTHMSDYFPKASVQHLMPPFLALIPFLCSGAPPLRRRGGAAPDGSILVREQPTGTQTKEHCSVRHLTGAVLAMSVSLEKKVNYMNNWPVIH